MSPANADVLPLHSPLGTSVDWDASHARIEDVFDAWVFAARDAELTLGAWSASPADDRAAAYVCYRAALDREERAAQVLAAAAARSRRQRVSQP